MYDTLLNETYFEVSIEISDDDQEFLPDDRIGDSDSSNNIDLTNLKYI